KRRARWTRGAGASEEERRRRRDDGEWLDQHVTWRSRRRWGAQSAGVHGRKIETCRKASQAMEEGRLAKISQAHRLACCRPPGWRGCDGRTWLGEGEAEPGDEPGGAGDGGGAPVRRSDRHLPLPGEVAGRGVRDRALAVADRGPGGGGRGVP